MSYQNSEGEWLCEDKCLKENSASSLWFFFFFEFLLFEFFLIFFSSGDTDHFTNFAILLDGYNGGGDCGATTTETVIGWLSMAVFIIAFVLVALAIAVYEREYRKRVRARKILFKKGAQTQASVGKKTPSYFKTPPQSQPQSSPTQL